MATKKRAGWVALTLIKWEHLETNWNIPLHPRMDDGCVGFLPVFETMEEAKEAHPDVPVLQIAPKMGKESEV